MESVRGSGAHQNDRLEQPVGFVYGLENIVRTGLYLFTQWRLERER